MSTLTTSPVMEHANMLAEQGRAVVPLHIIRPDGSCGCGDPNCKAVGKHPRVKWNTRDMPEAAGVETVERWFTQWPDAGLAMLTGTRSNLIAVDEDPRNGGDMFLQELLTEHGDFPDTWTADTPSGGHHYYFAWPGFYVKTLAHALGPGVDIKGDGGLIVVEPSPHKSGGRYVWQIDHAPGEIDPANAPAWVIEKLRELNQPKASRPAVNRSDTERGRDRIIAERLLPLLKTSRADEYDSWLKVGMILHDCDPGAGAFDLWERWSKISGRFEEGVCARKWASFHTDHANRCTVNTVLKYANADAGHVAVNDALGEYRDDPKRNGRINAQADKPRSYMRTDLGNAERLRDRHGNDLRYVASWGWLVWDGTRWRRDDTLEVQRRAKETVRHMYREAMNCGDDDARQKLIKQALASESANRVNAMIDKARSEVAVSTDAFDKDIWLFNCLSGTIDLRTGQLRPHCRDDLITKLAPVEYDPHATCPRFNEFMGEIVAGDAELIEYVIRLLGWSLTGDIRHHVLPIFWGDGANGKSTLVDLVSFIMGDYASEAPDSLISTRTGDEHPTQKADLFGKRLVVASETDEGKKLRIGMVKQLTGNARIKGRYMRQNYFEFNRTHKSILVTNNKPRITEDSAAVWRRVKLIPFTVVFPEARQDKALPDKLKREAPGILARLVRACLDWQRDGYDLREPDCVGRATADYRHDEDPLAEFLEACCVFGSWASVTRSQLWSAYQNWAQESGDKYSLGRRGLYDRVRKLPQVHEAFTQVTGKTQRVFHGVGLLAGA